MRYPYPRDKAQADKYCRRTEDSPIDAYKDRSEIVVPIRRDRLRLIGHDNIGSGLSSETDLRIMSRYLSKHESVDKAKVTVQYSGSIVECSHDMRLQVAEGVQGPGGNSWKPFELNMRHCRSFWRQSFFVASDLP